MFLIPWALYFISTLYFMTQALDVNFAMHKDTKEEDIIYKEIVGAVTLILLIYQAMIEYIQWHYAKAWIDYLGFWNFCDMF